MLTFLRIIRTVFIVCLVIQLLFVVFFLWTNFTSAATKLRTGNALCWTADECKEQEGQWGEQVPDECKKDMPSVGGKELKYCYAVPAEVKLGVAIGETERVKGIAEYIILIYKYLLGIAGILATIVVVVAGVLWLTAGGNTQQITTAKSYISNVLVGLILLFGAHFLLQTINPALIRLELPPIRMLRQLPFFGECTAGGGRIQLSPASRESAERSCGDYCPGLQNMILKELPDKFWCCECIGCPKEYIPDTDLGEKSCSEYCTELGRAGPGFDASIPGCCKCGEEGEPIKICDSDENCEEKQACLNQQCKNKVYAGGQCLSGENKECLSNSCNKAYLRSNPPSYCEPAEGEEIGYGGYCTDNDECKSNYCKDGVCKGD